MAIRRVVLGLAAVLLASCGGKLDDLAVAEVDDPGGGTGALLVEAFVKGEAIVPNAADPAGYRTRMIVRVSRRGVPVADATVRVNGLELVRRSWGTWVEPAQLAGLPPGVVRLEVEAGGDWVRAARSSPGPHVFTRPARGGDVLAWDARAPLAVEWLRGARADQASLDVGGFAAVGDIDDGAFAIPPGAPGLAPAAPAPCGLWRENRVLLAGGATGSILSVSVWNGLEVTLRPY